ncbi:MAG: DUF5309 family protein [Phycisphaerales bacterium]|nr:DUF5309 family protein [Phycisphaerales bacterium]
MTQQIISTYTGAISRNVARELLLQAEAMEAPILALLEREGRVEPTGVEKFEWYTDGFGSDRTAINNGGSAYDDTTTSIVVDDGSVFYPNSILYAEATGERMLVTAVSTNTLTVVRGVGSVAAASGSVANNADVRNIGSASGEGSDAPSARATSKVACYNYVQTFKQTVDLSGRLAESATLTEDERGFQRRKKYQEMLRNIETSFIFGSRSKTASGADSKIVTTTGGLLEAITTNVTNQGGTLTKTQFETFCISKAFAYGSGVKLGFVGSTMLTTLRTLYGNTITVVPRDTEVGINIESILVPGGKLMLVHNRRFGTVLDGGLIVVDPQSAKKRFMNNRDIRLRENIQTNSVDAVMDEWTGDVGLDYGDEVNHAVLKGVTGPA